MPAVITERFDYGDHPAYRITYTIDDIPTNPTAVTAQYRRPSDDVDDATPITPVAVTTGVYDVFLPVADEHGTWRWGIVATGAVEDGYEASYYVNRSAFA